MRWWWLSGLASGLIWWSAIPACADLVGYVRQPDPTFTWKSVNHTANDAGTVSTLHLISQKWQNITWEHAVQIYLAKGVQPRSTMMIWVTGGKPNPLSLVLGLEISRQAQTAVAFLFDIPNQPLLGNKREDDLIAETFVRYLESGDENWPLLFPMVKSVVRAMDCLQAYAKREWNSEVKHFVVAGASKRGWTAWLTATLGDPRVRAIVPMVIDVLNIPDQLAWQVKSLGGYSEMLRPYIQAGLIPLPRTERAKKLWMMVDPFVYREKINMPKLIVLGTNDRYWASDALNLYWDHLPGEKWVLYVPNAGHDLREQGTAPTAQSRRPINTVSAFLRRQATGEPMPKLGWKHTSQAGRASLEITWEASGKPGSSELTPVSGRLWFADAPTRDFRPATWKSQELSLDAKKQRAVGQISIPDTGCRAFFAELEFQDLGRPFWLSTQMQIIGNPVDPR